MKKIFYRLFALMITCLSVVSFTTISANAQEFDQASASSQQVLADELETVFTKYVTIKNDHFVVNYDAIASDKLPAQNFENLADTLNIATASPQEIAYWKTQRDAWGFTACVLANTVGLNWGSKETIIGALKAAISHWNWSAAAGILTKFLGPTVSKALGGPLGIAASLGWSAFVCRGTW